MSTKTPEEVISKVISEYTGDNAMELYVKMVTTYASQFQHPVPDEAGEVFSKEQMRECFNLGAKWAKEDGIGFNFNDFIKAKFTPSPPNVNFPRILKG